MIFLILLLAVVSPVEPKKDVALWLARSCVGEAGFRAHKTGECDAIWHIYLKRATASNSSLLRTARQYSATIKPREDHPRPWVLKFNRAGKCPSNFPANLEWSVHKPHWMATLARADEFLKGNIADPLPAVEHYGGAMDVHKLNPKAWIERRPPGFTNIYYEKRTRRKARK